MKRFWSWVRDELSPTLSPSTEGAENAPSFSDSLRIEGEIVAEAWWKDETAPRDFRAQLDAHPGPVTVWINSPGGDVFASSAIYTALREHGGITIKIDGLAASGASLIAMAGEKILMAPTALMMIHEPWMITIGSEADMMRAQEQLIEIREGMASAYQQRTRRPRADILELMRVETWMGAQKAVDNGFADGILYENSEARSAPAARIEYQRIARAFSGLPESASPAETLERNAAIQAAKAMQKELRRIKS